MAPLLPSEVARLVLGYLEEQLYFSAYEEFLNTCKYLEECRGREFSTKWKEYSLNEILMEYSLIWSYVNRMSETCLQNNFKSCKTLPEKIKAVFDMAIQNQMCAKQKTNPKSVICPNYRNRTKSVDLPASRASIGPIIYNSKSFENLTEATKLQDLPGFRGAEKERQNASQPNSVIEKRYSDNVPKTPNSRDPRLHKEKTPEKLKRMEDNLCDQQTPNKPVTVSDIPASLCKSYDSLPADLNVSVKTTDLLSYSDMQNFNIDAENITDGSRSNSMACDSTPVTEKDQSLIKHNEKTPEELKQDFKELYDSSLCSSHSKEPLSRPESSTPNKKKNGNQTPKSTSSRKLKTPSVPKITPKKTRYSRRLSKKSGNAFIDVSLTNRIDERLRADSLKKKTEEMQSTNSSSSSNYNIETEATTSNTTSNVSPDSAPGNSDKENSGKSNVTILSYDGVSSDKKISVAKAFEERSEHKVEGTPKSIILNRTGLHSSESFDLSVPPPQNEDNPEGSGIDKIPLIQFEGRNYYEIPNPMGQKTPQVFISNGRVLRSENVPFGVNDNGCRSFTSDEIYTMPLIMLPENQISIPDLPDSSARGMHYADDVAHWYSQESTMYGTLRDSTNISLLSIGDKPLTHPVAMPTMNLTPNATSEMVGINASHPIMPSTSSVPELSIATPDVQVNKIYSASTPRRKDSHRRVLNFNTPVKVSNVSSPRKASTMSKLTYNTNTNHFRPNKSIPTNKKVNSRLFSPIKEVEPTTKRTASTTKKTTSAKKKTATPKKKTALRKKKTVSKAKKSVSKSINPIVERGSEKSPTLKVNIKPKIEYNFKFGRLVGLDKIGDNWDADLRSLIQPDDYKPQKQRISQVKEVRAKTDKKPLSKDSSLEYDAKLLEDALNEDNKSVDSSNVSIDTVEESAPILMDIKPEPNAVMAIPVNISDRHRNEPPIPCFKTTPDMPRGTCSNPMNVKCNLSDLLITPMKTAMMDILIPTPKFISPSRANEPISAIKILNIPTPNFTFTPNALLPSSTKLTSPGSYVSRPTDYSSSSSYYKPDESDDICKNIIDNQISDKRKTEDDSVPVRSRPIRKCTLKKAAIVKSPVKPVKQQGQQLQICSSSSSSDSSSSNDSSDSSPEPTPKKQPSKNVSFEKDNHPLSSLVKDRIAELEIKRLRVKSKLASDACNIIKNVKVVKTKPVSKPRRKPINQRIRRDSMKSNSPGKVCTTNVTCFSKPALTKSRRKSATPRKLEVVKTYDNNIPRVIYDKETKQECYKRSEIANEMIAIENANDSYDINAIQEYITKGSKSPLLSSTISNNESCDPETAKQIESELSDPIQDEEDAEVVEWSVVDCHTGSSNFIVAKEKVKPAKYGKNMTIDESYCPSFAVFNSETDAEELRKMSVTTMIDLCPSLCNELRKKSSQEPAQKKAILQTLIDDMTDSDVAEWDEYDSPKKNTVAVDRGESEILDDDSPLTSLIMTKPEGKPNITKAKRKRKTSGDENPCKKANTIDPQSLLKGKISIEDVLSKIHGPE